MTATPLLLMSAWVAIDAHKGLLAQAPATAPTFKLPTSLPDGTTLTVDGSSSMTTINQALKPQFEQKFPNAKVNLATNGSTPALKGLTDGSVNLAAVGRPLTAAEKAQGFKVVPIDREKIAIVVGADNPFKGSITAEQFARMFRGEITNWAQVGGPNVPIRFIDRPETSDTRQALSSYPVFQAAPFQTGANATQVADDTTAVINELGKDGISYAIASQVVNQPTVTVLPMHDTLPTDPRYPYSQPRSYVYKEDSPGTLAFLGVATSAAGQTAIANALQQEATAIQQGTTTTAPDGTTSSPTVAASPSPDATAAPTTEATTAPTADATASPTAEATTAPTTTQDQATGPSPWWWLLLPLLGIPLLWWLLKGRGAAVPPVAAAATDGARMILTPRDCRDAYAYWEVPEERFAEARRQGGRDLKLRLYDVTDIRDMERQTPHQMKEFDCVEGDPDLHVPIAVDNRDYVAELGYLTADNRWIRLVRSEHVRVPACPPVGNSAGLKTAATLAATGVAAAGATAAARSLVSGSRVLEPSRMIMTPRSPQQGYVYWEVPEARLAELKQAGGQKLMVRVHDTTDITPGKQGSHSVRQYECDERSPDLHVPIPAPNRSYVAELGYATQDNRWLSIAKSDPVHVPATLQEVVQKSNPMDLAAGAAATKLAADIDSSTITAKDEPGRLDTVTEKVTGLTGDASRGAANLLDRASEKATSLTGDATKAVGAAIAGGAAAVAGIGATARAKFEEQPPVSSTTPEQPHDCRIILVPRNARDAYAYWEVSNSYKQALREQGGRRMMLRIHDATNLDIDYQTPHSTQTYVCNESDQDKHVVIPVSDRDYIAELGYFTDDNRWLRLIRSFHVRVPAQ